MNGPALVAARQRLGLTTDQLAAELGLPPHAYRACEEGRATLPSRGAGHLAYRLAVVDRADALRDSGLPECAWMADWDAGTPTGTEGLAEHLQRGTAHSGTCHACQARERFLRERFPAMPAYPRPTWMRLLGAVHARVESLPAWLRPAAWGALVLAALVSLRVLLLLPMAASRPALLLTALGAVLAASAAGAIGGLAYGLLGRPLRRVPVAGPYLAGTVAVLGYMLAILALISVLEDDRRAPSFSADTIVFVLVLAIVLGSILGHQLFRAPDSEPPTAARAD